MKRHVRMAAVTLVTGRLAGVLALLLGITFGVRAGDRPSIVFILADDLGYGDLACYGRKDIRTPAIDQLASQGVLCTQCYANAAECTPTRAGLMTGRYQQRVGGLECAIGYGHVGRYDDAIRLREANELGLPVAEISIARLLKEAGYATGISGKWHLGYDEKFSPNRHGFDHAFTVQGGGVDYFHYTEPDGTPLLFLNGQRIGRTGYLTDLITDDAVSFVRRQAGGRPFFLYVAYTAPHAPYQGPDDEAESPLAADSILWNQSKGARATYVAMIERLDQGVAKILRALDDTGAAGNTIVVFTSDNGAARSGSNGPLRAYKGTTFEGGIRVPAVVRWPGRIPSGTVSDQVAMTMDFTASFATVAKAAPDPSRPLDGMDILPVLAGDAPVRPRTLFWRMRRGTTTRWAVRDEAMKLVIEKHGNQVEEHLFDLAQDTAEQTELREKRPDAAQRIKAKLQAWEKEVQPVR